MSSIRCFKTQLSHCKEISTREPVRPHDRRPHSREALESDIRRRFLGSLSFGLAHAHAEVGLTHACSGKLDSMQRRAGRNVCPKGELHARA
ncbi:hypothetical protein D9M69_584540 [compost metagenome]